MGLTPARVCLDEALDLGCPPPNESAVRGYMSPSVGLFSLQGTIGQANFVWYDPGDAAEPDKVACREASLAYLGGIFGNRYWAYQLSDGGEDSAVVAFSQAPAAGSDNYRILYVFQDHVHLWAWDAHLTPPIAGRPIASARWRKQAKETCGSRTDG